MGDTFSFQPRKCGTASGLLFRTQAWGTYGIVLSFTINHIKYTALLFNVKYLSEKISEKT
jgi:hypothetical protein